MTGPSADRPDASSETAPPNVGLEASILGGEPHLTSIDVAARAGVDVEDARRLWRALGFPYVEDTNPMFVDADLTAVRLVKGAVDSGLVGVDTVVRLTRALGSTMSRLADWQVSTLLDELGEPDESGEQPYAAELSETNVRAAVDIADQVGPAFEQLLVYAWRRHLAAAVVRAEAPTSDADDETKAMATIGFADLVSFTQLSNGLDDKSLAGLVERFESDCTDIVTAGGGRAVKTLGDAVLFMVDETSVAVEIALKLVEEIGRSKDMPDLRVGLATGSVITRLGDVFGPPVNLAARLTTVARRNRVIVDHATAGTLGDDYETRVLPARPMHGFGNVEPVTVRRRWTYRGG
ncbi:adenylate/guanylate cyclase domain-containing protein [Solicola gregarius]|uniref:Adenylate/guanylate cyclase domain-containing protein n=1 Tax=Solicola gregarius TaxID=2908642 RepID=A0AA46TGA0_9ACTN|nr:adenylate/guanylate cyclase domain-containing protein [Solicola gregarius]UYM04013.1 adenylate/guanylate cyclase domain-containing protein [Solicola gregarius]